jgi:hypothetical protein
MTNTETQPTFSDVASMLLRMAEANFDKARDDASAKLATGDFAYFVKWSAEGGVRLQYRVRVLTKVVSHGEEAVVTLLGRTLGDTSRTADQFSAAVMDAERTEALALLRELRPHMAVYHMVDLTGVMV